jgi:hypothetical protein
VANRRSVASFKDSPSGKVSAQVAFHGVVLFKIGTPT